MAQTPSTEDLYAGDGVQTIFGVTFPYLKQDEVFVTVDGVNTPYTWLAGSTASVQLSLAPAAGTVVRVYRSTRAFQPLHTFAGGVPFLPRFVDENNRQLLYSVQEAVNETAGTAADALITAEEAKEIAQRAEDKVDAAIVDSSAQLRADLASAAPDKGANIIGMRQDAIGAVPRTVNDKLSDTFHADDFGVDYTGATNTTVSLKAFYTACISEGKEGTLPAGSYLVTPGELDFILSGTEHANFPTIYTAGANATVFVADGAVDAPLLAFRNRDIGSTLTHRFWQGGYHGGLGFRGSYTGGTSLANQHGLLLRGLSYTRFGYMRADNIGGSTIHLERKLFGGTNPDPYHVAGCAFAGVEANRCGGAAFYNDNYVGFSNGVVEQVRAIECRRGVFYGQGAACRVGTISAGSCAGWAVGDHTDGAGGSTSRFTLGSAELDDCQYGVQMARCTASDYGRIRFVHRHNFGPLNPGEGYWPRKAANLGGAAVTSGVRMKVIHRLEVGGTKAALGVFYDFNNAGGNLIDLDIQATLQDTAALGVTSADLMTNFTRNTTLKLSDIAGFPIANTAGTPVVFARAPIASSPVPNAGYGAVAYPFTSVIIDNTGAYAASTGVFTVKAAGYYRVTARLTLAIPVGNRVRLGVMRSGALVRTAQHFAGNAGATAYSVDYVDYFAIGETIAVTADQNTTGAVAIQAPGGAGDNQLDVVMLC